MASAAMPFALEVRELSVELGGRRILDRLAFRLQAGLRTIVLGSNGAGKSVLLRTLHGLIAPASGSISWGNAGGPAPEQAMVFQRPVLLRRSALANITYALAVNGIAGRERARCAAEALERVGLSAIADRPARVLSSGEQQRLALARAWSLRPRVLFLDEPTASLDPAASAEIERIVGEIHAAGTRIVMTTHNLGQARRLADEILFIEGGRVGELTPADEFFSQPRSPSGEAFLRGELPWR